MIRLKVTLKYFHFEANQAQQKEETEFFLQIIVS